MSNLLDAIQPGNRRIIVEGVSAPQARDTLEIVCAGATLADDPTRQRTKVTLPVGGESSEWLDLIPAISTTGAAFSLGNGNVEAKWRRSGADSIEVTYALTFGSTTSLGSGQVWFGIDNVTINATPVEIDTSKLPAGIISAFSVYLGDASTPANNRGGRVDVVDATKVALVPTGTASFVSTGVPWTWATGDLILFSVTLPFSFIPGV